MNLLFTGSSRDSDRQHSALKHLKEKISKCLQKVVIFCVGHHDERDRIMHLVVWQQYPAVWSKSCSASKGECFWGILILFFRFSLFLSLGSSVFFFFFSILLLLLLSLIIFLPIPSHLLCIHSVKVVFSISSWEPDLIHEVSYRNKNDITSEKARAMVDTGICSKTGCNVPIHSGQGHNSEGN